ncbi:MAG: hypothetical protein ABJE66_20720 [Deltaproteobacteria bacterium]
MQLAKELEADVKTMGARLEEVGDQHSKYPFIAVGIGVVVGFLLARALRR